VRDVDEIPFDRPWQERLQRFFSPDTASAEGHLWARWLFLRALGAIFFSAFYSLAFQIHGLIGPEGILPARLFLADVARVFPISGPWRAPTLLWIASSDGALTALVTCGLIASVLLTLNVWPRATIAASGILFLSFVSAAQDFSGYQSDGMLLEAAFLSFFFAPRGVRPRLGAAEPPSRASLFLLQWEWFRIYFESGIVKLASGDAQWRALTAMDHYYENGPLPTWLGWYAHQLPHSIHAASVISTFVIELGVVWMLFLPRRFRNACFFVVTALQIGIIATANYAFLNYIVLALGVLLLDDRALARVRLRTAPRAASIEPPPRWRVFGAAIALSWCFYVTLAMFLFMFASGGPLEAPAHLIEPFRIANRYGLFAVMTEARYEIEYQGTRDGVTWTPYPFRYKPQDLRSAPGIYAPYQPRFEWNLWFASLGTWKNDRWVVRVSGRLLDREPSVLRLFARDPFDGAAPVRVRVVLWQYHFTDAATRRATGQWWTREEIGPYAPEVERKSDGSIGPTGIL
jgi:hypothetical protein